MELCKSRTINNKKMTNTTEVADLNKVNQKKFNSKPLMRKRQLMATANKESQRVELQQEKKSQAGWLNDKQPTED